MGRQVTNSLTLSDEIVSHTISLPDLAVSPLWTGETSLRFTKRQKRPQGRFCFRFVPEPGVEHYMFSTPCRYFFKIAGKVLKRSPRLSRLTGAVQVV